VWTSPLAYISGISRALVMNRSIVPSGARAEARCFSMLPRNGLTSRSTSLPVVST
jgi:hypothetical protein